MADSEAVKELRKNIEKIHCCRVIVVEKFVKQSVKPIISLQVQNCGLVY
jgi:hypothetical protein